MPGRVDIVSKLIHTSASAISRAFATPSAREAWLPPQGITGRMLMFAFREGGSYCMRLTYDESQHTSGKTSMGSDEVKVHSVTVRCENVPTGIRREDHQAGLTSTLSNLAAFAEARSE